MGKVYFISGHRDLTKEEFEKYYVPVIQEVIKNDSNSPSFVVGDYEGCDYMAQVWLRNNYRPDKVTVYHMFTSPRHLASDKFNLSGGYKSDIERDSAMTSISDSDIAFIRHKRWTSGTAQNILRRYEKLE